MNQIVELKKQMKQHELQIEMLKTKLANIQAHCEHEFITTPLIKICTKCDLMKAEYY